MRIAIFQTNLRIGGIQRALLSLVKDEMLSMHTIDVYLLSSEIDYCIDSMPSNVTFHLLSNFPKISKIIPFKLARILFASQASDIKGSYDLAIDFDGYSFGTAFYALAVTSSKTAIWVHNDYMMRLRYDGKFRILYWAFKEKYSHFNRIIAVSRGVADAIATLLEPLDSSVMTVPNLVPQAELIELSKPSIDIDIPQDSVNVVCVGRLDSVKNPIASLKVFASAVKSGANLRLYFLGIGKLKKDLKRLSRELGVADRVFFLGAQPNPYPYIAQMDAILFNSQYEGQGIVLREAQVFGLALVFPERLEKYSWGLHGTDNLENALVSLKKKVVSGEGDLLNQYDVISHQHLSRLIQWAEED